MQKKASLWLGLAMLLMLIMGAVIGLYLTRTNQDIRQQAYSGRGSPGPGEVDVWCAACGGFWMPKEDFDKGWGCNTSAFQRCGEYPQPIKGAGYCDLNGCDGRGQCTVFRYHCNRNTNLGGGCQDTVTATSTGRVNFAANCGAEQIDVSCGGARDTDFVSKIYPTACGTPSQPPTTTPTPKPPVTVTPTPPTPPPPRRCGQHGCNNDSNCAGNLVCVQALNGQKYCARPAYQSACAVNPSQQTCCEETQVGPQCRTITGVDPETQEPIDFSKSDALIPGETQIMFVCSQSHEAAISLPTNYYYAFRVFEPGETEPKELPVEPGSNRTTYTIPSAGSYGIQCAVCRTAPAPTGGASIPVLPTCDWEHYIPR